MLGRKLRRISVAVALVATAAGATTMTARAAGPYGGTSQNGFVAPVGIPNSVDLGEPSMAHDSANRLFVTAPQKLGNVNSSGGSPMFTSTDGGATWGPPVRSQFCAVLGGGDTDLAVDGGDNVYQTDLWLGNSCLSVSTDHGGSFFAGNPFGTHPNAGDDRPWLAWNQKSNQLYVTYDGVDAVHASNTVSGQPPQLVQATQDNIVVPESAVNSSNTPDSVRQCVCPPGGIAIDNSTGAHAGRVYISYSYQHGTAISYGDLSGTCPVCTVTSWTGPIAIPGSDSGTNSVSAFEDEWNFDPIKVDGNGTLYVMWAKAPNFDATHRLAGNQGVQEFYSFSTNGGTTWHGPFQLSTLGGTTTFPTMDVVSPGVLDVSWYGDPTTTADPNTVPSTDSWNVYYARVTGADTNTPAFTPEIAVQGMHVGCIQSGGGASCTDRSLVDFYQLVDDNCGNPNIIYTGGDVTNHAQLYFTKLALNPCTTTVTAEVPWAPLLMVPAGGAMVLGLRRRNRRMRAEVIG